MADTTTIDFSTLELSDSFSITSVPTYGRLGDLNADGFEDVLAGGAVVFGRAAPGTGALDPAALDGSAGFRLTGPSSGGLSHAPAGDLNGDGIDDAVIGNRTAGVGYAGGAYVIFGKTTGFAATLDLSTLTGADGFRIAGAVVNGQVGHAVSAAGDINGDGVGDLIVGAPGLNGGTGGAYVLFGDAGGFDPVVDVSTLDGSNGFRLTTSLTSAFAGNAVAGLGDVNGDGFDDIAVGAAQGNAGFGQYSGACYVVFGSAGGFAASKDLQSLDGSDGFRLTGSTAADQLGLQITASGDLNGDAVGDFLVVNFGAHSGQSAVYVVFGRTTGFDASIDIASLTAAEGFKLFSNGGVMFNEVAVVGDFNGDGHPDFTVGGSNVSYLVFGKAGGFTAPVNLASLERSEGYRLQSGQFTRSAGDFNGDGLGDLYGLQPGGKVVLVYGHDEDDRHNDTITGGAGHEGIDGGGGFDRLDGAAGDDSLDGGARNDTLTGDAGDDLLTGGTGGDVLDGGADFDVASYGEAAEAVVIYLAKSGSQDTLGGEVDTLISIEGLIGSAWDDLLFGSSGANRLDGGLGDDQLDGGAGADSLDGGAGDDALAGGSDGDLLAGGAGEDQLSGGSGDDTLRGGPGADTLGGGSGIDTASYADATGKMRVAVNQTATGPDGVDRLIGIENLTGSAYRDRLTGDLNDNALDGGAGRDQIIGGLGADLLTGGAGRDSFVFRQTADSAPGHLDRITDLTALDRINLRDIDANTPMAGDQAFVLVAAFTNHRGEIMLSYDSGSGVTSLLVDINGDGVANMTVLLDGDQSGFTSFVL